MMALSLRIWWRSPAGPKLHRGVDCRCTGEHARVCKSNQWSESSAPKSRSFWHNQRSTASSAPRSERQRHFLWRSITMGDSSLLWAFIIKWTSRPLLFLSFSLLSFLTPCNEMSLSSGTGSFCSLLPLLPPPLALNSFIQRVSDGLLHHCHEVPRLAAKATNKDKEHISPP